MEPVHITKQKDAQIFFNHKDQEPTRAHISHLSHDGRGIAHVDGKITFIFGALTGEEVLFLYTKKRAKFDEAVAIEIISPSPKRSEPQCSFFGSCGGCSLQHLEPSEQINHKEQVLLEHLQHFGNVIPKSILPSLTAKPYGYRRKARYSVRYVAKKDRVLIGFRELFNARFLADINACSVLHPTLGELLSPLQDCLNTLHNKRHIAQIEAAAGENATALIIRHLEPFNKEDSDTLIAFAKKHGIWLYLQPNNYQSIYKFYPNDDQIYLTYPITNDITLNFHPADFTQINDSINKQMINQALTLLELKPSDIVLDLFCGIGNFSLPMAHEAAKVYGVEGDQKMVDRATMNAKLNDIENAAFFCADLNKPDSIFQFAKNYNKILIDPPRSGAKNVVENIDLKHVETIVYVSCNPATLARDAGVFKERGFELVTTLVMDMFTHTEHVEAMACFKRS